MYRSSELPDDQSVQWPVDTVAESILQYIEIYKINAVVTFDKYGVSRHKNHISLYFAIATLCIQKKVPPCQYQFAQFCSINIQISTNKFNLVFQIVNCMC